MREITVLSGKGGTGKTSVTAALASIAGNLVCCDNDVDAPDLHLIMDPKIREQHTFPGGRIASIHQDDCTQCGICHDHCRFNAIHVDESGALSINPFQCEGCRLCERVCPEGAISSEESLNNAWFVSDTRFGILVHARMAAGEENSGKLVTQLRRKARDLVMDIPSDYILSDGPPGIGCPVIASLTSAHAVLIVTEPTRSGLHDLERLTELVQGFNIPLMVIINKYDINREVSFAIEDRLRQQKIPLVARIPFTEEIIEAMIRGQSIVEYRPQSEVSVLFRKSWGKIADILQQ